ncbi:MAG: choice-of-anchor D domain-containing protein [Spirochaetota bacterium]
MEKTKAQPEIVVSGKLEVWSEFQSLDNHPEGMDFSFVEVYNSRMCIFSIENRGDIDLQIRGIALSDDSSQFILDASSMETRLASGERTEFSIFFMPTRVGCVSAEVVIESNDPDTPIYRFAIRGVGTEPLSGYSGPQISVSLGSSVLSNGQELSFGQVEVERSSTLTLTIRNTGDVILSIGNILYSGEVGHFVCLEPPLPVLLSPDEGIEIIVEFKPQGVGMHTMSLTYINNDPSEGQFSIMFTGEGKATPVPDICVKLGMNEVLPGSVGYDFGRREVGTPSAEVPFTVENVGSKILNISDVLLLGGDSDQFSFGIGSSAIEPGEYTTLGVSFNPNSKEQKSAQIIISNDDPDENPFIFTVQGYGVEWGIPDFTLWRSNDPVTNGSLGYDFGDVQLGTESVSVIFTIKNYGTVDLVLDSSPSFISGNMDQFSIDVSDPQSEPITIAPGEEKSFSVKFTPNLKGTFEAIIGINTNDPDTPLYNFRVKGVGTSKAVANMQVYQNGSLIMNGSSYNFGNVLKGSLSNPVTFYIKNSGTADLQIKSYKKLDGKPKDFIVDMDKVPFKIAPGGSRTFTITFKPSAVGEIYTRLEITSNDVIYYIRLEGRGI